MEAELWKRVQRVFQEALDLPPEQRAEFLRAECGSDQELRLEVESLLAAHDDSGFMANPAIAAAGPEAPANRLKAGDTLGVYEIGELIGAGGMGEVYRARDPRLQRNVAIKVLPAAFSADRERLRRFQQEARSAAALNHPNIISVYDLGTFEGSPYIVGEFLEGENLREVLRRGPVGPRKALDYAIQAAQGLAAAHDTGIIHRDLKPENLFITKDGRLKILDFGLAKLAPAPRAGAESIGGAPHTDAGHVFGTLGYMSPEQVRGQAVDHRADIFSFGAILYELFSGKRAFSGGSAADTMSAILHEDPPELSRATPPVNKSVNETIRRCLQKHPQLRFQSAHELALHLKRVADGGKIEGVRFPSSVMAIAASLLIVVAVVLLVWLPRTEHSKTASADDNKRVIAVLPFENISQDASKAYFSAGMAEEINARLSKLASLQVISRAAVAQYKDPRASLHQMARELGIGSAVAGSVRQVGDRVRVNVELVDTRNDRTLWSEQYDRELQDIFGVQSDVAVHIADALATTLTNSEQRRLQQWPTQNLTAYQLYLHSEEENSFVREANLEAMKLLDEAIAIDPRFALATARLAYRQIFQSYYDDPKYLDLGIETARRALAIDPQLAEAHFALGTAYGMKGRSADAHASLLKALSENPNLVPAMNNLSVQESDEGRYDEALKWAVKAFQREPNSTIARYHVAGPLLYLADDDATEKWLQASEHLKSPNGSRIQIAFSALDLYRGRREGSLERIRQALDKQPDNQELQTTFAEVAFAIRDPSAERLVEARMQASPGLGSGMMLPESTRLKYAYLLAKRGDTKRSAQLIKLSEEEAQKAIAHGNQAPYAPLELAAVHVLRSDLPTALNWLQRAYDAGWRDPRIFAADPLFQPLQNNRQFLALLDRMTHDVAAMRARARKELPDFFQSLPVLAQ